MLVSAASASYPMFHHDTQRTGYVPQDGPLTNVTLWVMETAEFADGSPGVHNGKVFVTTWPDMDPADNDPMGLVCYNATTGAALWTNELGGAAVGSVSGVAIADGQVYLGGTDGRLYCIDEETGETLWRSDQIDTTGYYGLSSSPLVYEGTVYTLSASDGVLHAFAPDGNELWSFPTNGAVGYLTSPAAAGGKVFIAGNKSSLFCIDTITHTDIWSTVLPTAVKSTPVIGDGKIHVTTAEHLYALDASTGAEIWNANLGGTFSTPVVAGGTVIAGSSRGLYAYNAMTGTPLWNFPSAKVDVSPIVAGSLVYAATNEKTGTLYAVDAGTGDEVWSYILKAPDDGTSAAFFTSSPAISDGILYIGAENNRFYAFGEGSVAPTPTPTVTPTPTAIPTPTVTPTPTATLWNGTVVLVKGETFSFTPSNNASASYTVNRTTDLGALVLAAQDGGFTFTTSDTWYEYFGSFLLEDIAGIANEDWTQENARSWSIFINGATAPAGLGANTLADGDRLTFYYCPSDPDTYAPLIDQADHTITIDISIPTPTLWNGTVVLVKGETFSFTPSNNASASYTVNRTTDLGALVLAAQAGGFTFTTSDTWYEFFGSFLLEDVAGIANEDWTQENARSWSIFINGATAPAGLGANTLADGDRLTFYYCPSDPDTYAPLIDQADHTITIDVVIRDFAWEGAVSLKSGQTFTVTPFNNESAIYTISRVSALGALDAAATKGGFDYTIQETTFGPFLYSIADIDYDEATWDSWLYSVNGVPADVGAADHELTNGDVVTYWYGAWGSIPETARAVITITVSIPTSGGSGGGGGDNGGESSIPWITTTLNPGTFTLTADNSKQTYNVDRQTALGALDAAGVGYTVDDSYYSQYGSLFIDSIRGTKNEGTKGWMYQVNGESPGSGANTHSVRDGDKVIFFWSESMSSTPATSSDVIYIKVKILTPSSDSGSSGGGGSGSAISSTTGGGAGSSEPGSLSFLFGLPAGVTIELGEWGQTFSVMTGQDSAEGEVTISGNTLTINRGGIVMTIAAKNINEDGGMASGLIESVTATTTPVLREIEGVGNITASLTLNLTGIPTADSRLDITFNATTDAATGNTFALAAAEEDEEITALAYTMSITRTNLENGEDITGAVIRMTISPKWVDEHGGVESLRIVRSAEDGTYQVLETWIAGTDENGNLIVEATSPGGLSIFGLLTVKAAPAVQDTGAATGTTPASDTLTAAETPAGTPAPSLSSPLVFTSAGATLLIGAAYLITRRREQ